MDPRYAILFEPLKIGPVTAPNRFVSMPHAIGHSYLMPNGAIGIRETRAEGGWGIVAMQLSEIDPTSDLAGLPYERLWDDGDVAAHARSVERIHAHGALASIELAHTGIRSRGITTGYPAMGPSVVPILKPDMPLMAKAMDREDIRNLRRMYRAATRRAKVAGYDIAYVYASHEASILWHFLSPAYNFRTDEYGGSFENRLRLFREVLEETKEEAGDDMAVAVRFAVHELSGPRRILNSGEGRAVVEALADLPDLWDVNVSSWSRDSGTARYDGEGFQEEFTRFVKQVTGKPVLGVGRFTSPDAMVSQIRRGVLDFIGAARPSIADPFLPAKIREGRIEDIRECIGCNMCVAVETIGVELRCTQNPTISEEWRRGWHPEKIPATDAAKSVLIVGSGPAGLEAALVLAKAGHEVTVAERADEMGGRSAREARLKGLSSWGRVKDYRLYQLQQMPNVNLYPGSELDADGIAEFGADHVLLATGAPWRGDGAGRTRLLPIPGFAGAALTPDDIMNGVDVAPSVVIYDDDHYYMANALAADLAAKGHQVHLVSPMPSLSAWMGHTLEQPRMIAEMKAAGVRMYPNSVAAGWAGEGLVVNRADTGEALPAITATTLIAVGTRLPDTSLGDTLAARGRSFRTIGDAECPGVIQGAVYSGHRHARELLGTEPEDRIFRRERPTLFL
ncbi:FAD-dependent oxidoreductase [Rhizobium lentis]|uniref:oxidoreductase n=1 Tax=Rhizobium lentis TaxID=1138194 RepID=UPI001C8354B0|nr:FAD-dependent oxidoreductase [Rhizobium lentis]MBX5179009.1 FAD-dependent oxidoreductase [Rhizobium lentis]